MLFNHPAEPYLCTETKNGNVTIPCEHIPHNFREKA